MAKYKIIPSSRTIVRSPISIGHKAEKGVEAIEFDLTAWVETYGSGTLTVIMRRWGDAIPYPIALEIDENNKATWTLSDIDTAKAGMSYAQLNYIVGDEVVKKSDIYTFRVMDSLTGEGEPPEAYESWLEHLTHLAAEAMAEVLDIEGVVTDKTLTVDGGIADAKAAGDALALKADKSTTYTKTEVDQIIEDVEVETDTTLTISGAPADAKATGDALSALEDAVTEETDKLKADLGDIEANAETSCVLTDAFTKGRYIKLNISDGSTVDVTTIASSSIDCIIYPCKAGDRFTLTGTGGTTGRLYGFTDTDYKLLSHASASAVADNATYTAPEDGYAIFNFVNNSSYSVTLKRYSPVNDTSLTLPGAYGDAKIIGDKFKAIEARTTELEVLTITDPYQLRWVFGTFSASAAVTNNNNAITLDLPIKIYSIEVSTDSTVEVQMRFVPTGGEAVYRNWSTAKRTFNEEGSLRMSVRYADTSVKCNDISILDHLTLKIIASKSMRTVDYLANNVNYGMAPLTDYVGRHTDETGFGQYTIYADSLALWRGLPVLAPGYITETDLGEIFTDGPHMYKYVLSPPYQARSGRNIPHIFITTSMHAHEKSATYGMYYLIKDMLDNADKDPVLFYLRNFVKFTIMPMVNPYGWDAPERNHAGTRYNENGINLNRNFSTSAWHDFDEDTTYTEPYQYSSRGDEPFSEIETQRIRDAIMSEPNLTLIMDLHTNGNDTESLAEIGAVIMNLNDVDAVKKTADAVDQHFGSLKPHMDALYGTDLGNNVYGTALISGAEVGNTMMSDWGYESVRKVSLVLEVLAGSNTDYLEDKLTAYSADVIKLSGEMIGNFICKLLHYIGT